MALGGLNKGVGSRLRRRKLGRRRLLQAHQSLPSRVHAMHAVSAQPGCWRTRTTRMRARQKGSALRYLL